MPIASVLTCMLINCNVSFAGKGSMLWVLWAVLGNAQTAGKEKLGAIYQVQILRKLHCLLRICIKVCNSLSSRTTLPRREQLKENLITNEDETFLNGR